LKNEHGVRGNPLAAMQIQMVFTYLANWSATVPQPLKTHFLMVFAGRVVAVEENP